MPYTLRRKLPCRNCRPCWGVLNKETGHWHSKCTTRGKARRQLNLLNAVEHGWTPSNKNNMQSGGQIQEPPWHLNNTYQQQEVRAQPYFDF